MAERRPASERPVKTGLYRSPYDPSGIEQEASYIADELIIKYREGVTPEEIADFEQEMSLDSFGGLELGTGAPVWFFYQIMSSVDALVLADRLQGNPLIEAVEPNIVRNPRNDPFVIDETIRNDFGPMAGGAIEEQSAIGPAVALIALALVMGG